MDIRPILPGDNIAIAEIVRTVMTEFNADPKTTVLGDSLLKSKKVKKQKPVLIISESFE